MNRAVGRERVAAIRQRRVAEFLEFVQRRKFSLKNLLQVSLCICRHLALCQIKTETGQRRYDDHHGGKHSSAKAHYAFVSRFLRGTHRSEERRVGKECRT